MIQKTQRTPRQPGALQEFATYQKRHRILLVILKEHLQTQIVWRGSIE